MNDTAPTRALRIAWFAAGALALVVAAWGIADFGVYDGLVASDIRPGALSQDVITVPAGLALCAIALTRRSRPRLELVALGLLGYLFYGYGIYVIERMYNALYLAYLAVFTVSFWSVVIGTVTLVRRLADRAAAVPHRVRLVSAWGALLQPVVFYPLWIGMLVPLMARRDQIDSLYSIFVLDLCFIMPAFLLVAVGLFRRRAWAALTAPAMFVLGAALILSLALGELVKPAFGMPIAASALTPPVVLTAVFTVLAVLHLRGLRLAPSPAPAQATPASVTIGA